MLDWLWRQWVGRPAVDWILALTVTGIHLTAVWITGGGDVLAWPDREQRIAVYTATATVAAVVGSFITAAVTLYAASTGERMRTLRTHPVQGPQFRRNWMSILSATLVVSGLCLLTIILDTKQRDPGGAHWLASVAIALGVARATRLVWLFGKIIIGGDIDLVDAALTPTRPAPTPLPVPPRRPGARGGVPGSS
ncbi:hypothetical protein [Streptomyces sp. H27-C3]|uniref:hypothetical protein n=1 Tax=Streptomyces sp. H27-C3 TaxID=3046305 RepID=UPI0024BA3C69|nr:hypothetical protein [Streptomyces sp. H27-C3]MDJ0462983.1 hypothetical protein [Streptomyces sp. H27-C3]